VDDAGAGNGTTAIAVAGVTGMFGGPKRRPPIAINPTVTRAMAASRPSNIQIPRRDLGDVDGAFSVVAIGTAAVRCAFSAITG
jgi:hypothetical protein